MCGIAGAIDLEGREIEASALLAMNQAIAHRGPDDEGYVLIDQARSSFACYSGESSPAQVRRQMPLLRNDTAGTGANIGLAHRRFAIIDLSPDGHQPFFDSKKHCVVAFNGEIYNYVEVRDELVGKGAIFHTHSDTEVLLEAYKYWGTECFSHVNGFWAIALFDFRTKQLLLSRDRIGKKPLYWTRVGARVYFASEIKALLSIPDIYRRRKVNEEAIFHWVTAGLKDLDTATFFAGIHSLPAGSWTWVEKDFPTHTTRFWEVPRQRMREKDISTVEASRQLRSTVEDAVRIRLRADVPLSVELSGGMDSSSVVALAAQACPQKITTYTVRFPGERLNEEPYARMVAQRYNVDYRVLESPTEHFWSQILSFTHLEEEPYHSPNLQTAQVIWTQMRAAGTKIALSGAAGDLDFAGYQWHFALAQRDSLLGGRPDLFLANALLDSGATSRLQSLLGPLRSLSRRFVTDLMPASVLLQVRRRRGQTSPYRGNEFPGRSASRLTLSEFLRAEMTSTLNPYYMRSGDRGYMGVPLEARDPLLDFRVIDLAFQLPVTYLIRNGWRKWIFRKAMEDLLPAEIVWRKKKMGFPFPYAAFQEQNRKVFDKLFTTASNPFLDLSKRQAIEGNWKLISFLLWYEYYFNESFDLFMAIEDLARHRREHVDYGFRPEFLRSCDIRRSPHPAS
jgi:asparagine synthase (glutamine-hydrolysing)